MVGTTKKHVKVKRILLAIGVEIQYYFPVCVGMVLSDWL